MPRCPKCGATVDTRPAFKAYSNRNFGFPKNQGIRCRTCNTVLLASESYVVLLVLATGLIGGLVLFLCRNVRPPVLILLPLLGFTAVSVWITNRFAPSLYVLKLNSKAKPLLDDDALFKKRATRGTQKRHANSTHPPMQSSDGNSVPTCSYNLQFAEFEHDQVDDLGIATSHDIVAAFDAFDWPQQVEAANEFQKCSPTFSVHDEDTDRLFWVSGVGEASRFSFLNDYTYGREIRLLGFLRHKGRISAPTHDLSLEEARRAIELFVDGEHDELLQHLAP